MALANRDEAGVRLRKLNWRRDRDAVLGFQYEVYETNFPGYTVDDAFIGDYSLSLRDALRNPNENLLVLEKDGRVVGFVWMSLMSTLLDTCVGYIKNLYVVRELRGQGYGRMMLEAADEWFQMHGATKATLDASVVNKQAVGLYERVGYQTTRLRMEKHY